MTSNPSIFNQAIKNSNFYDAAIAQKVKEGKAGEALFFELAIEDLTRAAELFGPIHERTNGLDGFVSLEVSPRLAYDTQSTLAAAQQLYAQAKCPNLFIKIPGTREGLPAIEEAIFAGVPINVTLLFSLRALPGRGRRLPARYRAAGRGRAEPTRRIGRVGFRQPLGWRGGGQSPGRSPQQAGHRHRRSGLTPRTATCSPPTAGAGSPTTAPTCSVCCGPAPAPNMTPRRPTIFMSGRWPRRTR